MADDVTLAPMTGGPVIAADDVGGVMHQRVKIGHGDDGSYTDVSATAPLPVAATPATTVGTAMVDVTTAGTAVQLPDHAGVTTVSVKARDGNTGPVYVGGTDVSATVGWPLKPGEMLTVAVDNPSALHADADNGGDGVCVLWTGGS